MTDKHIEWLIVHIAIGQVRNSHLTLTLCRKQPYKKYHVLSSKQSTKKSDQILTPSWPQREIAACNSGCWMKLPRTILPCGTISLLRWKSAWLYPWSLLWLNTKRKSGRPNLCLEVTLQKARRQGNGTQVVVLSVLLAEGRSVFLVWKVWPLSRGL